MSLQELVIALSGTEPRWHTLGIGEMLMGGVTNLTSIHAVATASTCRLLHDVMHNVLIRLKAVTNLQKVLDHDTVDDLRDTASVEWPGAPFDWSAALGLATVSNAGGFSKLVSLDLQLPEDATSVSTLFRNLDDGGMPALRSLRIVDGGMLDATVGHLVDALDRGAFAALEVLELDARDVGEGAVASVVAAVKDGKLRVIRDLTLHGASSELLESAARAVQPWCWPPVAVLWRRVTVRVQSDEDAEIEEEFDAPGRVVAIFPDVGMRVELDGSDGVVTIDNGSVWTWATI